jgi:hypothetical protein
VPYTVYPAAKSLIADASPIPEDAPVTSATRFFVILKKALMIYLQFLIADENETLQGDLCRVYFSAEQPKDRSAERT